MKQVLINSGTANVVDVPAPRCGAKSVLVETHFSSISAGTELAGLSNSALPLYRRALKQPQNVARVIEMAREHGIGHTLNRVRTMLDAGTPAGYSAAGVVIDVGSSVTGFARGDRVACAGAGIANHAEIIDVPVNLCVSVPENVDFAAASTVTLGAIAMQGVRRVAPTLGETVVVVGLGILGQLSAQLLAVSGCRVIGVDLDDARIDVAQRSGMWKGINAAHGSYVAEVTRLTEGFGADAVLIAAASGDDSIIHTAMQACRKKGRVVLVGDVALNLRRSDFYAKELDFLISCSYGPGRYDPVYEQEGQDYPVGYVRWTENRNMGEYLRLLAHGAIDVAPLISGAFAIERATDAYAALRRDGTKPLIVLLQYPERSNKAESSLAVPHLKPRTGAIGVAIIGAGSFAQGIHLPNLAKLPRTFRLRAVMNRTGSTAAAIAKKYGAELATTDYADVLEDPAVDLVFICTRHDLHAPLVKRALDAGKHVFVEKPLAVDRQQLEAVRSSVEKEGGGRLLMTGFNRRFSPAAIAASELLAGRTAPLMINYRMNAGFIPSDHWVHGSEGGGRNIGEACHIYDLFNYFTRARVRDVSARGIRSASPQWHGNDNFVATVQYDDGSVCTLLYCALGHRSYPKEQMEIFVDGSVLVLDDYKSLKVYGQKSKGWSGRVVDKGHRQELEALGTALAAGGTWPISAQDQFQATEISFLVEDQLRGVET
jgi:predicted dehydrogenase/threonine dehydrogenase-like Zn-dependent dehydrogenase